MNNVSRLPYKLPSNQADALKSLAKILNIPLHLVQGDPVKVSQAMSGTIMYRQLDRNARQQVMAIIHGLSKWPIEELSHNKMYRCVGKSSMGEWSLTTEELTEILKFHNDFNRWSSILGANPGAYGAGGAAWSIIKQGASSGNIAVLIASIALVGIHEFSYSEMQKYTAELEKKKMMLKYTILSVFSYLVLISFAIYLGTALPIPALQGNNIIALLLPVIAFNYKLNIDKGFSRTKVFIAFIVSIIYCSVSSAVSFILQAKLLDTVEISLVILFPFVLLCILMAAKRI